MLIGLGSQSHFKRDTVVQVLSELGGTVVRLICVPASSGVNEQPMRKEISPGVCRRARHTAKLVPDADFIKDAVVQVLAPLLKMQRENAICSLSV